MLWIVFTIAAVMHLGFLWGTFRLRAGLAEWVLRVLLVGLMTDNLIVAAGAFAIDSGWYEPVSRVRFVAHVVLLPLMVLAGLDLLRRAGRAQSALAGMAAMAFAAAAILYGIASEIAGLELVRETLAGHPRYVAVHAGPPLATIVTNIVILAMAAVLWRAAAWPWLLVGAMLIFLVNAAMASSDWSIVAGNIAEVAFAGAWLASCLRFRAA